MNVVSNTNIGLSRLENQDRVIIEQLAEHTALAVLCDGMGGENAGGEASERAVHFIFDKIRNAYQMDQGGWNPQETLLSAIRDANTEIYEIARNDQRKKGMGTTCVAVLALERRLHIVNAGDSRAYLVEGTHIRQVTADHTMVQMLVEQGKLKESDAQNHPQRNLITRAVGVAPQLEPDYFGLDVQPPYQILLCSDGLSNYCSKEEMLQILTGQDVFTASDSLMRLALEHGGQDNISLAIVSA